MDRDKLIAQLEESEEIEDKDQSIKKYLDELPTSTAMKAPTSAEDSEAIQAAVAKTIEKKTKTGKIYGASKHLDSNDSRMTTRMRQFASNYQRGMTPAEAYKASYVCRNMTDASVCAAANKLLNDDRVQKLLQLTSEAVTEILIDDVVAARRFVMKELINHAKDGKAENTKLKALELMGRAVGMYTDKVEQKTEEVNIDKLKAELKSSLSLLDLGGKVTAIKKRSA
jgi:hypothetical protein